MTDPIPDEAVEAVEAVLIDAGVDLYDNVHDLARLAVTAAAPLIAAQDRAEVERLRSHVARNGIEWCMCSRADRMNERRISRCPYHGDSMAVQRNIAEQERDEARATLADLRAGIEALRDEWRMHEAANLRAASTQPENSSGLLLHTAIAGLCKAHVDALDALLREGE